MRKFKVVDTAFNRANYPDLIGHLFDVPPGYAQVELITLTVDWSSEVEL